MNTMVPEAQTSSGTMKNPSGEVLGRTSDKFISQMQKLAGYNETETNPVFKDHFYAKPWNWKPEHAYIKPIKKIFFPKSYEITSEIFNEKIDVETDSKSMDLSVICDLSRPRRDMDEFQRFANFAKPDENHDWEENIVKTLWTPLQTHLFTRVHQLLTAERLSRLAKTLSSIEPIYRQTSIDKTAKKFRKILASTGWDWRLIHWLHSLLFKNLPKEFLSIYLEILQTLRSKIPDLINKMIAIQPSIESKSGIISWKTLGLLFKHSWDPLLGCLNANCPEKLPSDPIFIVILSGLSNSVSSRQYKWILQLRSLGLVVNVHSYLGTSQNNIPIIACVEQLIQCTRSKIQDIRHHFSNRPVILVGFNSSAALACQVARMDHVTAVICLGFPFKTADGKRGSSEDILSNIRCPAMFVIGENSNLVCADDIEEIRGQMSFETVLIVVGSADDNLRISTNKKILEGITQSIVDRCIIEEIGNFVVGILFPHPLTFRPFEFGFDFKMGSRKRNLSVSSSTDSEASPLFVRKTFKPKILKEQGQIGNTKQEVIIEKMNYVNMDSQASGSNKTNLKQKLSANNKIERVVIQTEGASSNSRNRGLTVNIESLASLSSIGSIRFNNSLVKRESSFE